MLPIPLLGLRLFLKFDGCGYDIVPGEVPPSRSSQPLCILLGPLAWNALHTPYTAFCGLLRTRMISSGFTQFFLLSGIFGFLSLNWSHKKNKINYPLRASRLVNSFSSFNPHSVILVISKPENNSPSASSCSRRRQPRCRGRARCPGPRT